MTVTNNNTTTHVSTPPPAEAEGKRRKAANKNACDLTPEELALLRDGCQETYHKLYMQYLKPLHNFINCLTRSQALAEELTQQILVEVWLEREKINPNKNIKNYLFTVARHTISNYYRSKKVRDLYISNQAKEEFDHSSDMELIVKETELYINIAMSDMPKQRRTIFECSYREGLSPGEIAERLNISKHAVEKQISYARSQIRKTIAMLSDKKIR
ncbi:MAG: RNA polymerase sigma-70 factor [Bacteroidales bacterium]|jgi:RNA polymerase sigma-70 factor (ECF subfamily)|nr:RNA polymerase sigma-70 factor [Bacteroidales bacterium]